jgi:hypothetical protein
MHTVHSEFILNVGHVCGGMHQLEAVWETIGI